MSTRSSQLVSEPSWKQEVNRRIAAHQSRKGLSVVDQPGDNPEPAEVSDRAAKAAARVAARFSSAPSYAEMQAAEARAALREAEVATRAALEAQAVAQAALAQLERIAEERAEQDRAEFEQSVLPEATSRDANQHQTSGTFYAPSPEFLEATNPDADMPEIADGAPETVSSVHDAMLPQTVEAQPIHANLIHFPRELVATRRIRPRLSAAGEPEVEEHPGQLSIFEVDPSSIAIGPSATVAEEVAPAPSWSGPEWTSLDLDLDHRQTKEFDGEPPSIASRIDLAPLELRCMAALVDFALIVALACAGAAGIASHLPHGSAMKIAEMAGAAGLLLTGLAYYAFFLLVTLSTPGMMYAGISLCTFDDEHPTRMQLRGRLGALMVSLLPVGLGMAWAIFDEDHLSWHDRISRTYLRRC